MPSSTTLYTSPGNAGNVASKNFTTLYSGSGSINPTQPYGNANVVGLLAASTDGANTIGIISATGNIISDGYFIGNGSQLTGIVASSVNANALTGNTLSSNVLFSSLTTVGTLSNVSVSGTVTAGNLSATGFVSATGNVTGNYIIGNGSLLTNINAANVVGAYGNANVADYLPTFGGNILFGNLLMNPNGGNATIGPGTGATAGMVLKNISTGGLTNTVDINDLHVDLISIDPVNGGNASVTVDGAFGVYFRTTNVANVQKNWDFTDTGDTIFPGPLRLANGTSLVNSVVYTNVDGTAGQVLTTYGNGITYFDNASSYGNANVTALLNNFGSNSVSTTGNVTASYVIGNGSLLSNITGANVTGVVANATFATTAGSATTAVTVTGNAQANITSVGTLSSLSVTGNTATGGLLTNNYYYANGTPVSFAGTYSNANVTNFMANFGSNTITTTGNITAGYFIGNVVGNIVGNVVVTGSNTDVLINNAGNIGTGPGFTFNTAGNLLSVPGPVSATGNITGAYIAGNGSLLTNLTGANVTGTVANATYATTAGSATTAGTVTGNAQANITSVGVLTSLSVTGNVDAGNLQTTGTVSATGNIRSANNLLLGGGISAAGNIYSNTSLRTGGTISATGNTATGGILTDNYYYANGTPISFAGTYSNTNVVNLMATFGSNSISTTGNITSGNITVTADALIQGNLTVNGNTTFINSNVVTINDKFINVANNAATAASANGGGLGVGPVGGEYATLEYLSTPNVWATNIGLSVTGNVSAGNISATGNTATGGLLTDNYYYANGTPVSFAGTYGNSNVVNLMAAFGANNISTTGNVSTGKLTVSTSGNTWTIQGNTLTSPDGGIWLSDTATNDEYIQSAPGGYINMAALHANGQYATQLHLEQTVVQVTADANTWSFEAGNLTLPGNSFAVNYANGTPVSLAGTYANANVADFLATFGANSISTTGNVTAGYFAGNGSLLTNITGANVTGTVANATYATSSGSATTAGTVTGNAQANITSVGTLTSLSVTGNTQTGNLLTGGIVSATGNITGNYILGNGSQLTGLPATYGNADVVSLLASFGSNSISTTGNVTAGYFAGNGSLLSNITGANVTGTVANATYATTAGSATTAGTVTANAQANITSVGTLTSLSVTGNVDAGNVRTAGIVSATGTATAGNVLTGGLVSAVGNVQGGNLIIGSDVQLNAHVQSAKTWDPTVVSGTVPNPGRITIGTGYDSLGNFSPNYDLFTQGRNAYVYEMNKSNIATAGLRTQNFTSVMFANVNANINSSSNGATRLATNINGLVIGGGTSGANLIQSGPQSMAASIHNLAVGGIGTYADIGTYNAGNQWFNGLLAAVNVNNGSNIGVGVGAQTTNNITVNGAANTLIGFAAISSISNAGKLNIGVYIPTESNNNLPTDMPTGTNQYQGTSPQVYGNTASGFVADYYGIRIDSNVAKQKLGSINTFHQTNLATSASGNITINKNNGQFQTLNITADTTITGFANVVTQANTGGGVSATYYQSDTITLVIRQSSTGNTVTMPTGAAYKYTSGSSTITSTANAVQLVTAIAVYNTTTAANEYLIDISPVYS